MPYLTPDTLPTSRVCRTLRIPNSPEWLAIVSGAILELTQRFTWEKYGTLDVDDCVNAMVDMFGDYYEIRPCMIGAVLPYATGSPPDGTLACDGATYNRVDYPDLYDSLDAAFIVDASQFRVPDLRGRNVIGNGQGGGFTNRSVGDSGGAETHTLVASEMPIHAHSEIGSTVWASTPGPTPITIGFGVGSTGPAGGDGSHNNMSPFLVLRYCIVAR